MEKAKGFEPLLPTLATKTGPRRRVIGDVALKVLQALLDPSSAYFFLAIGRSVTRRPRQGSRSGLPVQRPSRGDPPCAAPYLRERGRQPWIFRTDHRCVAWARLTRDYAELHPHR